MNIINQYGKYTAVLRTIMSGLFQLKSSSSESRLGLVIKGRPGKLAYEAQTVTTAIVWPRDVDFDSSSDPLGRKCVLGKHSDCALIVCSRLAPRHCVKVSMGLKYLKDFHGLIIAEGFRMALDLVLRGDGPKSS
jgi:hypothetical protein